MGHTVTVVTEQHSPSNTTPVSAYKIKDNNLKIYRIPITSNEKQKKIIIWNWLWKNRRLIKNADIIHCHDVFFWYLPFRFIYLDKKVYTTFHGYESYPLKKKAIVVRKMSELLSNGNICIGEFIEKWYYTNATIISYGAVRKPRKDIRYKKNNSAVFIGRLDEQTGVLTYAAAVRNIRKKTKAFAFTIVGDGPYKEKVKKENPIGFKENPELFLIKNHYAFVSRYLSILEALIYKRLVFAVYDNPIKKDYLLMSPFSSFIVTASSSKELSQKIRYYLTHPKDEKELIENGYKWAKDQTWDRLVFSYLSLWANN